MDQHTYDNWMRIKTSMEESGKTNNQFYRRACEIQKTKKDPLAKYLGEKNDT